MPDFARYAHTVRHLSFRQIVYQVVRRLFPTPRVSKLEKSVVLRPGIDLCDPLLGRMLSDRDSFTFLKIPKRFDSKNFDWASVEMDKLWRYNLHYFDYLLEKDRPWENKSFLIDDWIARNPQGKEDAWEPFPVSLRIVNWIKLFLSPESKGKVEERWLLSLCEQARWLERNIEYHLLANHYFKNGKALLFAGLFFAGRDAERWLKKGLRIISAELEEQVLPDGGHFERSPMYHAMVLEDCLDILNLGQGAGVSELAELIARLREKCRGMLRFLLGMSHPDGQIALFNDAAFGIEARPAELAEYYERITGGQVSAPVGDCWAFPETGYFVMAPKAGNRLLIDCGPVGPDYQPGHAHCDTLSFELSLKGRRVIVDSGCSQYVDGETRRYNRSNAGHNTLTIDGHNQSEIWGAHRCARRAYPIRATLEKLADGSLHFSGSHDGYRRLKGKPIHYRHVTWDTDTYRIEDRVEGQGIHDIETRLHIHPDLTVDFDGERALIHRDAEVIATISLQGSGRMQKWKGWYCPEFGLKVPCTVLGAVYASVPLPFSGSWVISTGD